MIEYKNKNNTHMLTIDHTCPDCGELVRYDVGSSANGFKTSPDRFQYAFKCSCNSSVVSVFTRPDYPKQFEWYIASDGLRLWIKAASSQAEGTYRTHESMAKSYMTAIIDELGDRSRLKVIVPF